VENLNPKVYRAYNRSGGSGGNPYRPEYVSMTDKEKLRFLKEISKGGDIHFMMRWRLWGWFYLSPERVLQFMQDEEAFMAKMLGVSVERLRDFLKWHEEGRPCRALTVEGRLCRNKVSEYFDVDKYQPGINDRCYIHQKKSER
jgi:hypothetical protein